MTPLPIMESRYLVLQKTFAAFQATGIPLLFETNSGYTPAITADDIGLYCIIPSMMQWFSISLENAITTFFNGTMIFSLIMAAIGFFLSYKSWVTRSIVLMGLALTAQSMLPTMDVYRISGTVIFGTLPLFLYFIRKNHTSLWLYPFLVYAGLYAGLAQYIRIHSGTNIILFIVLCLLLHTKFNITKKLLLICTFMFGFVLSSSYFMYQWHKHVIYIEQHLPEHHADKGAHVFWHQVYLGFGFLQNDYNIQYDDHVADMKVQSICPNTPYPCKKSERLLREEVFKLILEHPIFALYTYSAKVGILLLLLFLFANVGLLAAWLYRKPWYIDLAFIATLSFSALPGLLTIPTIFYLLGFTACATLYGLTSIGDAVEHNIRKKALS
ncbi:hypothetical protein JW872_00820 [Candidatus Babeliales bacterium]|nr:hypothetical protein [Candidatus Babeliales bacterium]